MVSQVFHILAGKFESWKKGSLITHNLYVFADGNYFPVFYNYEGCKKIISDIVGNDKMMSNKYADN
jgi:hypothetical protein